MNIGEFIVQRDEDWKTLNTHTLVVMATIVTDVH